MRCHFAALLILLLTQELQAEVLCPRVTSEHNADTSDLGRFREYHKWKDKEGQELAIAVWQYLCSTETGLYHMQAITDGSDPWSEYSLVRDPIKIMNVYNVGFCGIFGPVLDGVYQGIGFETGRAFSVPKWYHTTTEVWYNGGWHYFDLDVRGALLRPDGTVASVAEAQTDRSLWTSPKLKIEPFFPSHSDKSKVFEIYRDSPIDNFYHWFQGGHVMDFRLRQGETFTRYWRPQDGRWHHLTEFNKGFVRDLLETEPIGYKSNHPEFSIWTQGNGLWNYAPNLTTASSDFADGVRSSQNLQSGEKGLVLKATGEGEAVFEVFSPWIIVPKVNDLDNPNDDTEASVVTIDAARPVTVSVSLDHGRSWTKVTTVSSGRHTIDLTRRVKSTYGFLVKLSASGIANETVLRSLAIKTWVQVAPISLPRLKKGINRCRYDIGDRYDKPTVPMFVTPNVADPEDLKKYVVEMPADYDLKRRTSRIRGDVILRLEAPEGMMIDWFTAGASFLTHQNEGARSTDNRIAYAVNEPVNFIEVYKAEVPTWVNHWRYQWDEDIRLKKPARVAFVRYTGQPGLNVIRATLHLVPACTTKTAIEITHGYKVAGKLIEKTIALPKPGEYTVKVDGNPENTFIRLAVPSKAK